MPGCSVPMQQHGGLAFTLSIFLHSASRFLMRTCSVA